MTTNVNDLLKKYAVTPADCGDRYQRPFAELIKTRKHGVVVETGCGISTMFIMSIVPDCNLYSIDPKPHLVVDLIHPHWTYIKDESYSAMVPLFKKTGAWDVFLHDSEHKVHCMTYELELAYQCLRGGGIIAADDCNWDNHQAWLKFCKRYNLKRNVMGSIEWAEKPLESTVTKDVDKSNRIAMSLANIATSEFEREHGNH